MITIPKCKIGVQYTNNDHDVDQDYDDENKNNNNVLLAPPLVVMKLK